MSNLLTRLGKPLTGRGLVRPPTLQTDQERSASRLELFFDLAFVLVIAELGSALGDDLTPHGVLVFAGLFTVVWWSWVSSTLYANRFDHDDVVYRLTKLASMLAVIGMAASAGEATGASSTLFAACYIVLRVLLLGQYARAWRHVPPARPSIRPYLVCTTVATVLWAGSLAFPAPARFVLWGVGILVEAAAPLLATAAPAAVPLHLEHLPERFALFVILVLGESVAAIADGVHEVHWTAEAMGVAGVCFVLAAALWWSYFDVAGTPAKRMLQRAGGERSSVAHDLFIYGQLPLSMGLAAVGVGIEHAILESTTPDATGGTRVVLCGGVALYLAAVSLTNTGMKGSWRSGWLLPMLAAAVTVADAVLALPAVLVVGASALVVLAVLVTGIVQQQRGRLEVGTV